MAYLDENDLGGLPLDLADFLAFFEQRESRVRDRLVRVLGTSVADVPAEE